MFVSWNWSEFRLGNQFVLLLMQSGCSCWSPSSPLVVSKPFPLFFTNSTSNNIQHTYIRWCRCMFFSLLSLLTITSFSNNNRRFSFLFPRQEEKSNSSEKRYYCTCLSPSPRNTYIQSHSFILVTHTYPLNRHDMCWRVSVKSQCIKFTSSSCIACRTSLWFIHPPHP